MKFRSLMTAICVLAAAQTVSAAPYAYIANSGNKTVSVIDTAITPNPLADPPGSNAIVATVTLPDDNGATLPNPYAYSVTVGASGQYVYVGLQDTNEVVVIDAATNTIAKRISLLTDKPGGLAVNAAETRLYVAVNNSNTLRVIDISGTGASEVGRVAVSDSAQSAPEGVVLNSSGTKAYVANSAEGLNSVAEITLDEATNTYTRSSLINTGVGSKPFGLAISSDGTKLYFASMNGNAGIVNTSTYAVTPMATDLGNLSVAVNPVSGNVYAPSNAMDQLFAFNSAGSYLGSYASASGPWGISVTPNPSSKLFVAMNLSNNVKVYDTANLAAAPATVTLPAGAKPTSLGKFIGPALPYTIAASATAPCTISPNGTVYASQGGSRTFEYPLADCKAKVNGVLVTPDYTSATSNFYAITNVIDNSKTIAILPMYTLTASWTGAPGGYLVSIPAGITNGTPIFKFLKDSRVEIKAPPGFTAQNWTGDCAFANPGTSCIFDPLDGPKTFGAELVAALSGPFYNVTKGEYYQTWDECTASANNYDFIKLSTAVPTLTTAATGPASAYQYKLSSQWDQNSTNHSIKGTYASLSLIITNIAIVADDLVL